MSWHEPKGGEGKEAKRTASDTLILTEAKNSTLRTGLHAYAAGLHCHYGPAWPTSAHGPHGVFRNVLNSELRLCLRFCQASPSSGMPSTGTIPKLQLEHGQTSIPRLCYQEYQSSNQWHAHFSFIICWDAMLQRSARAPKGSQFQDLRTLDYLTKKIPFEWVRL